MFVRGMREIKNRVKLRVQLDTIRFHLKPGARVEKICFTFLTKAIIHPA